MADQDYELYDADRPIRFTGTLIAEANTQSGTSPRWTELALYKTKGGNYVLETVGRSDIYHSSTCSQGSKGKKHQGSLSSYALGTDGIELEDYLPCPNCSPDPYSTSPVFIEQDIKSASVHETIQSMVAALYHKPKHGGQPSLSKVARLLLGAAMAQDPEIERYIRQPVDVS